MREKNILHIVFCCIIFFVSALPSRADTDSLIVFSDDYDSLAMKPKFGLFFHYGTNFHIADFTALPGIPGCCPEYSSEFSDGITSGLLVDIPLNDLFTLNLRAGYMTQDIVFESAETINLIIDGTSRDGVFNHVIDAHVTSLIFELGGAYRFYDNISAHLGVRMGYFLTGNYEQFEQIVQPEDRGTFPEGGRVRNYSSGEIPGLNKFQASAYLGFSYELPMNKRRFLFLSPEIYSSYSFTPVAEDMNWYVHSLRGGLAIKYRQPAPPPPPPPPPLPAPYPSLPMPEELPPIVADISAVQIDSNDNEKRDIDIRIEDFISINMRPLLNYVFFDENSADIPERYIRIKSSETDKFSIDKLAQLDALPTYYHLLNIVGKRLSENPDVQLTLTGTNSNSGEEENNKELSMRRAESIKEYLQSIWNIPEKQITLEARNLPEEFSRSDEPGGDDENRRVEINADGFNITESVITIDTLRKISKSTVRFIPNYEAPVGVKEWSMKVFQGDKELIGFQGSGEVPQSFDWVIQEGTPSAPTKGGRIYYSFEVADSLGQKAQAPKKFLPVDQLTIDKKRVANIKDKEFEYYSLILFDFGKTGLGREHRKVVDFVKNRISDDSEVIITGHTDNIGEEAINQKISRKRAEAVADRLRIKGAKVNGLGESNLLYDNTLPEGRFYCRTVRITIETPVRDED